MLDAQPQPEPTLTPSAALDELAQLALALARHVQQQALATADATELTHLTAAFERVSRTTRRTIQLRQHLATQPRPANPRRIRELARRQALRALDDDLEDHPESESQALEREFLDRLDHPDTEADFLDTPPDHVIGHIRRDLGLVTANGRSLFKRRTAPQAEALNAIARALPGTRSTHPYTSSPDLIQGPDPLATRNLPQDPRPAAPAQTRPPHSTTHPHTSSPDLIRGPDPLATRNPPQDPRLATTAQARRPHPTPS